MQKGAKSENAAMKKKKEKTKQTGNSPKLLK